MKFYRIPTKQEEQLIEPLVHKSSLKMSEAPLILTIDEATMPPVHDSAVVIVRNLFFNVSTRALSRQPR